jgi:molecular chaperone GrpE
MNPELILRGDTMIKINDGNSEPGAEEKKVPEEVLGNAAADPEEVQQAAEAPDQEVDEAAAQTEGKAPEGDEAAENMEAEAQEADEAAGNAEAEAQEGNMAEDDAAPAGDEADEADCGNADSDEVDCDEGDCEADCETEDADKKPGMFFGSRKLKKELEKKAALLKEQNEKYVRLFAEFDNYRKRTEKEKSAMYAMGVKDIVEKILPVVDNFERGFSLVESEDADDPFTEGMRKIYKQLMTTLADIGVTPIEAVGKEFDPNLHNAVMHVEDESVGENIVVQEFQKGYMYKDSVVRHSMVQVAN